MSPAWYEIENVAAVDSPAFIVYPQRVKENIRVLKNFVPGVQWLRPHVKTCKNREAVQLMMDAGITKFKCATIAEAEMLALCGAADVLLAYQPTGPKLQRFIKLVQSYPAIHFSCLVDHVHAAQEISAAASVLGITIPFFIDLNVGMNRTGIAPESAMELAQACAPLKGIQLIGLHVYDGHIHDASLEARAKACNESFARLEKLKQQLAEQHFQNLVIVAGGTPTFPIHSQRAGVECSPGTFIYWDYHYERSYPEQPFLVAALVVTRVVSLPSATTLCLDVGHKAIASENSLQQRIYFLNAPDVKMVGHSEEHLVVEAGEGHRYKIGDVLYGVPHHVCPTAALYERAVVVEDGQVTGEWQTVARNRKLYT